MRLGYLVGLLVACGWMAVRATAAPDYWDPRLDQVCGLFLDDVSASVSTGQGYWRLTRGEFEDESESGFNHHIYYKALDVNGSPIENQKTWTSSAYTNETDFYYQLTKGAVDGYWGNFPMYASCPPGACGWPYNAWIDTASSPRGYVGPSDKVWGMGMHNPSGTGCGAHVNFRLTWRWTIKQPTGPAISRNPSSFSHTIAAGDSLANDTFTVSNSGGGTLSYTITDNAGWLSVSPAGGSSSGASNTHTISYDDVASLPVGQHTGTINITSTNADNSPQTIGVTINVDPLTVPGDMDGDLDVDQTDFGLLQVCILGDGIAQESASCAKALLDGDPDVDAYDVAVFLGCMSGADVIGDPDCKQ